MPGRRLSLTVAMAVLALSAAPAGAQAYRGAVTALTGSAAYSNLAAGSGGNILLSSGWFGMLQAEGWAGRVGLRLNGGLSNPPLVDDSLTNFRLMTGDVDLMVRLRHPYANLFFQPYAVLGLGAVRYELDPDTAFVEGQVYGPNPLTRTSIAAGLGADLGSGPVALRFEMLDIVGLKSPLARTTGTAFGPVQHFVVTVGLSLRFGHVAGLPSKPHVTPTTVAIVPASPPPATAPARPRPAPPRHEPRPRPPARPAPAQPVPAPAPAKPTPTPTPAPPDTASAPADTASAPSRPMPAPAPARPEPTPVPPPHALPPTTGPRPTLPARPTPMPRPEQPGPGTPRPTRPAPIAPVPTPADTTPAPTPPDTASAPTPPDTTPAPPPPDTTTPDPHGQVHGRLFTVLVTWSRASQPEMKQAGAMDAAMSAVGVPVWPMPDTVVAGKKRARARVGALRNDEDGKTLGAYLEATYGFPFDVIHIEKSQQVPASQVEASEAFVDGLDKAKGKKGGKPD